MSTPLNNFGKTLSNPMLTRLIALFLLFPLFTYSQEIKPPMGLEFGMSKSTFLARMFPRFQKSKEEHYLDKNNIVTFSNIDFGTTTAYEFTGEFFEDKLYRVTVQIGGAFKYEMNAAYSQKYGKPFKGEPNPVWKTQTNTILFRDEFPSYLLVFENNALRAASIKKANMWKQRPVEVSKDY